MRRSASLGLLVAVLIAGVVDAQDPEPRTLRVVLAADGTPMPGVPVHVAPFAPMHGDCERVDGWTRLSHWWLRRQRAASTVRSDPDGLVQLVVGKDCQLFVGPPFTASGGSEPGLLRVDRQARYSARALDHTGAPLVDFGLQLIDVDRPHGYERERALACTDRHGNAVFGVEPTLGVRLQVVPFGWLGPLDGLPVVPDQQQRKHATLRLPPFGTVRLRTVRRGVPEPFNGTFVLEAPRRLHGHVPAEQVGNGLELWPVAVGAQIHGQLLGSTGVVPFVAAGPTRAGEVVTVDVEVEPARREVLLRLDVPDLDPLRSSVGVGLWTDAGQCHAYGQPASDGTVRLTILGGPLGARVHRVDVDLERGLPNFQVRAFTATMAVDMPVGDGALDLGVVTPQEWPGSVRGRVVTSDGMPVPNADVLVAVAADRSRGRLQTGDDGTFQLTGAARRNRDGQLLPIVLSATKGVGTLAARCEEREVAQGSFVTLTLPPLPTAYVHLYLQPADAVPWAQLRFEFVDATGHRHRLEYPAWQRSTDTDYVRIGPLPRGIGRVCVGLEPGGEVAVSGALTLSAEGREPVACTLQLPESARLRRVRCVNAAGLPIVGAVAVVRALDGATYRSAGSDTEGWLELAGASAGQVVTVQAPGFATHMLEAVVDGCVLVLAPG